MAANASIANASNAPITPTPVPTPIPIPPASAPAAASIGAYKGVPIAPGSQADIAAQIAKINASQSSPAPVIPVSSLTGSAPTPITPASPPPPAPVPKPAALVETPAEVNQSEMISELKDLNTQEAGKAAATTAAYSAAGVDQIQQAINDNTLAIKQLNDKAAEASINQDNRQAPEFAITGSQAQIERSRATQALGLSSISDALSNNLTAAKAKADQVIAAQFGPIESSIAAYTQNLALIQNDPETSVEDKNRAQEASIELDAYTTSIAQQKTDAAAILQSAQTAATKAANFTPTKDYPTLSSALSAIASATTPLQATEIATAAGLVDSGNKNQIIGSADSGYYNVVTDANGKVLSTTRVSGPGANANGTFSTTQVNNGAANAGVPIAQFSTLAADDKNFFINSFDTFTKNLSAVQGGTTDPTTGQPYTPADLKANIDAAPISETAKQILYAKAKSAGVDVTATPSSGGGIMSSIWDFLTHPLGGGQ